MKVVVLGGGVVGTTAAYELQKDGHDVVVLERNRAVGDETSWGNAGMVAPGHSFAWSSPSAPLILLKSLVRKNQALRFTPSRDPRLWAWSMKFLAQCTAKRAAFNSLRKHKLAAYSQAILHETLQAESIDYDRNARGILYFYRQQASLDRGIAHMQLLADAGQEIRVLDRTQVLALEPSLASAADKIAGGIYAPTDETGDCSKFTKALAAICTGRGAEIRTDTEIQGLDASGDRITGVRTNRGTVKGDAYVMALGNHSPILAKTVGEHLPIYPVKGYSLTIPVGNHTMSPTIGSVDEDNLVAISSYGDRMRVTATAEICGYNTSHKPSDFDFMKGVVQDLYPDGADFDRAEMWAGLRPMTPTNLPIIGRKRHANLYYNTGHGHIGWTMSHGSARILADVIGGRAPALPLASIVN